MYSCVRVKVHYTITKGLYLLTLNDKILRVHFPAAV